MIKMCYKQTHPLPTNIYYFSKKAWINPCVCFVCVYELQKDFQIYKTQITNMFSWEKLYLIIYLLFYILRKKVMLWIMCLIVYRTYCSGFWCYCSSWSNTHAQIRKNEKKKVEEIQRLRIFDFKLEKRNTSNILDVYL